MDPVEMEADRLEEECGAVVGEALSKRQKARMNRNMRETSSILNAGGLSPVDKQGYILAMQRMLLDAMEASARQYSHSVPFTPERHDQYETARQKLDSLWDITEGKADSDD